MPPFFSKPPIPRPQNLFIYSIFTLKRSLKSYPKHFKCLKIETKETNSIDSQILSKPRLKALQRRAKSLKVLDLENHKQFFELKVANQALGFLKSCNNISSLILFDNTIPKSLSGSRWLTLGYLPNDSNNHQFQNPFLLKSHLIRHKKQWTKLSSFNFKSLEIIISQHRFETSTLNKLLFSPKRLLKRFRFNLVHLDFQLYHATLPFSFDNFSLLLNSHKIMHLTAFASDVFDHNDQSAFKLRKFLNHFQSLRSINLGIHSFLCISILSKFFEAPRNLRRLSLYIPIQKQKELVELALFIGSLKILSLLAIVNSKSIEGYAGKGHRIFFTQISGLPLLKSLKINLYGESIDSLESEIFYGCLGEFADCAKRLHELQEIEFTQSEFGIAPEFDSLADALKKKGSGLRRLKIKFVNGQKKIDHLKKLNKAFKTMENLEELSLENLWTESESLIQFSEIISELKLIRSVKLDGENPSLKKADLVRTIKKILMKYGLEELKWFGNDPIYQMYYFLGVAVDFIDMKEIILRNPRLYSVRWDFFRELRKGLIFKNAKSFLS